MHSNRGEGDRDLAPEARAAQGAATAPEEGLEPERESFGPLALTRLRKDDGRSLILYELP
jgi:hypothetical protein